MSALENRPGREKNEAGPPLLEWSRNQTRVLSAYAELIEELGTDDVSFRLISRRAGVGERTIFRHYGTRTELLAAVVEWIDQTIFAQPDPESIFDVPLLIRDAMSSYHRRPELSHVVAETAMRDVGVLASRARGLRFDQLLRHEIPDLADNKRRAIVAALSHLDSASTWVTLRRQFGMNDRDIADAAAWAAEAVLNPIRAAVEVKISSVFDS